MKTERKVTGGDLVATTLRRLGVRFVFGIPGGQTLSITDGILRQGAIRFVTTRHEAAAASMADAIGRLTGAPGVCLATTGPGATNLLSGVGGAYRDSSPVLVLTCNNTLAGLGRDEAQGADHVAIFRPLTKWATLVTDAGSIPRVIEEAYVAATTGCPGPVLIDFPRDLIENAIESPAGLESGESEIVRQVRERPLGDPASVARAATLLLGARRPVLWLGNGAKLADAGGEALQLAELLDMPVITTFNGIGSVPTTHPNVMGPLSRMGVGIAAAALESADVLLAVGNSLNAISTGRWTMAMPETIVQIDIDPQVIGRYYFEQTHRVTGDARGVLEQVMEAVGSPPDDTPARERRHRLERLVQAKSAWLSSVTIHSVVDGQHIPPDQLVFALRDACPDDTILAVDAGNPGVWTHLWEIRRPRTYLKPVGYANMGFALPAAIAAKLAYPETPVVALLGDGSLGMSMGELETVAREGVTICIVVMNDLGYGNIRQEQDVKVEGRRIGVDLGEVDYAAIARACGIHGETVRSLPEFSQSVSRCLENGIPTLLDVRVDPNLSVWTYPPFKDGHMED